MRAVHLEGVEAEPFGALGGGNKGIDGCASTLLASSAQRRRLFHLVRHRRRALGQPAAFRDRDQLSAVPRRLAGGLAAGMGELHRDRVSSNACAPRR